MGSGPLDALLDLVLPKRCVVCGAAGGWLCETCSGGLRAVPDDRCRRCGAPRTGRGTARRGRVPRGACIECRGRDLAFARADAAFAYEGAARSLVTACKFRALRSLVDELADRAAPAFAAACGGASAVSAGASGSSSPALVTAVPPHREHRLERGFDQAELFARRLAKDAGLTYAPLLRRVRHGARQSGLARGARAANVRDAFALRDGENGVRNNLKRVVIVDDVYTTGETLNQCAVALARIGVESQVFTFARTVRAPSTPASRKPAAQKERCR